MSGSDGSIPYTILLDEKGKKLVDWIGAVPFDKLVQDSKPILDKI